MVYLEKQLQFLYFLQDLRDPLLNAFFLILNLVDTQFFYTACVIFTWVGCSWKWGTRLASLAILSGLINLLLKQAFSLPRPEFFDPDLPLVSIYGFGFPSGGAQSATLIGGLLLWYGTRLSIRILGGVIGVLLCFSRLYLGVHFPIDVIGGFIIGIFLLASFILFVPKIERFASRKPLVCLLFGICFGVICFLFPYSRTTFFGWSAIAISLGIYLSTQNRLYFSPKKIKTKILFGLFGIFSTCFLGLLIFSLPIHPWLSRTLQTIVIGFWVSLAASPTARYIFAK